MTNESPQRKALNTYGSAPQEWKDHYVAFRDLRKKVLDKIFSLTPDAQGIFLERIWKKERESIASVSDPAKYLTHHQSIGSSVGPLDAPLLDFEGEHSLVKFYEELDKEIG